jgi:hypothetical protein
VLGPIATNWTLILGPKFSRKERRQMSLSRSCSIAQIEYHRNLIFKRHFPIHVIFARSCEIGLWRRTANRTCPQRESSPCLPATSTFMSRTQTAGDGNIEYLPPGRRRATNLL